MSGPGIFIVCGPAQIPTSPPDNSDGLQDNVEAGSSDDRCRGVESQFEAGGSGAVVRALRSTCMGRSCYCSDCSGGVDSHRFARDDGGKGGRSWGEKDV